MIILTDHFGPSIYQTDTLCSWTLISEHGQPLTLTFIDTPFSGIIGFSKVFGEWTDDGTPTLPGIRTSQHYSYPDSETFAEPLTVPNGTTMSLYKASPLLGLTFTVSVGTPQPLPSVSFEYNVTTEFGAENGTEVVSARDCNSPCTFTFINDDLQNNNLYVYVAVPTANLLHNNISTISISEGDGSRAPFVVEILAGNKATFVYNGTANNNITIIFQWWIQPKRLLYSGNGLAQIPFNYVGKITYPDIGFFVPQLSNQVWTMLLPIDTEIVFMFNSFLFSPDSQAELSFSLLTNQSFTPVTVRANKDSGLFLVVIPPQSKCNVLSMEFRTPKNFGGGFELQWFSGGEYPAGVNVVIVTKDMATKVRDTTLFILNRTLAPTFALTATNITSLYLVSTQLQGYLIDPYYYSDYTDLGLSYLYVKSLLRGVDVAAFNFSLDAPAEAEITISDIKIVSCEPSGYCATVIPYYASPSDTFINITIKNNTDEEIFFTSIGVIDNPREYSVHVCVYQGFPVAVVTSPQFHSIEIHGTVNDYDIYGYHQSNAIDVRVLDVSPNCTLIAAGLYSGGISILRVNFSDTTLQFPSGPFINVKDPYDDTNTLPEPHNIFLNDTHIISIHFDTNSQLYYIVKSLSEIIDINSVDVTAIYIPDNDYISMEFPADFSSDLSSDGNYLAVGCNSTQQVILLRLSDAYDLRVVNFNDDNYFGSQVHFSDEYLIVAGAVLYYIPMSDLLSKDGSLSLNDVPYVFFPNRFTGSPPYSVTPTTKLSLSASSTSTTLFIIDNTANSLKNLTIYNPPTGQEVYLKNISKVLIFQNITCIPGFYKEAGSSTPCIPCPLGFYQNGSSPGACLTCPNNSFCPTGSVQPIFHDLTTTFDRPLFTEESSQGVENEVFKPFFGGIKDAPGWLSSVLVIWFVILLFGVFLSTAHYINNQKLTKAVDDIKMFLRLYVDDEMEEKFDTVKGENIEEGSTRDALVYVAKVIFIIIVLVFVIYFFVSYHPSTVDDYSVKILNNQRSSFVKPRFTRDDKIEELLNTITSVPFKISINITDLRGPHATLNACEDLCTTSKFTTVGCSYRNGSSIVPCSTLTGDSKSCQNLGDVCAISISIPGLITLLDTATFTFNLSDSFSHSINITITMDSNENEVPLTADGDQTKLIRGLSAKDYVVPTKDDKSILFGITRTFELTPVIQSVDTMLWATESPKRYILSTVFVPQESQSLNAEPITLRDFLNSKKANTLTLKFTKSSYYVLNSESVATNIGDLILQIVLIIGTVVGVFEVLLVILDFIIVYGKKLAKKLRKKKEDEDDAESPYSPRTQTVFGFLKKGERFNPYKATHLEGVVNYFVQQGATNNSNKDNNNTKKKPKKKSKVREELQVSDGDD